MVKKNMTQTISIKYIENFDRIVLIQPLAYDKHLKQVYDRVKNNGWKLTYSSDSAFHICPADGVFRSCADCGALDEDFDVSFCMKKVEVVSSGALVGRIKDCLKAGLKVEYLYRGDTEEF